MEDLDHTLEPRQPVKSVRTVGGYPLLGTLGKGGMGEVWLSRHPTLNIPVAVKLLSPDLARTSPEYAARFLREARLAAALDHSAIVRVYETGSEGDTHFIAMEYVDGTTAAKLAADVGGKLVPCQALALVLTVAEALRAAAKIGIIHRDIKPDNIMVTRDGKVKLADLGIARQLGSETGPALTDTGSAMGTPYYISPEQAMDTSKADLRSDIYSLGATFYHLVVGQVPHSGSVALNVMMKHVQEPLPHPQARNPELPDNIAAVICKMMEKRPEARYQTYDDLIEDLTRIRDRNAPVSDLMASQISKSLVLGLPSRGEVGAAKARPRAGGRRLKWIPAILAVVLAALAFGTWSRLGRDGGAPTTISPAAPLEVGRGGSPSAGRAAPDGGPPPQAQPAQPPALKPVASSDATQPASPATARKHDVPLAKRLGEKAAALGNKAGTVVFQYSAAIHHDLLDFPQSRRLYINRDPMLARFRQEPGNGKILSPEFGSGGSATLRMTVKGAVLVYMHQGFGGTDQDMEKRIAALTACGWELIARTGVFLRNGELPLESGFLAMRVCGEGDALLFEPAGLYGSLPTLVFAPVGDAGLSVTEATVPDLPLLVRPPEPTVQGDNARQGPVVRFGFDSITDGKVRDDSGNRNDGTVENARVVEAEGDGGAIFLDADAPAGCVEVADRPKLTPQALTVSAWVRPSIPGRLNAVVDKADWANGNTPKGYLMRASTEVIQFQIGVGREGGWQAVTFKGPISSERWTHIVGTYDGTALRLFVNGSEAASAAVGKPIVASRLPLLIGQATYEKGVKRRYAGFIDDVSIWPRALTEAEVRGLFTAFKPIEPFATVRGRVAIWNTHNGLARDRGTKKCNLVLYYGDKEVARKKDVGLTWEPDGDVATSFELPRTAFDRIRIEVTEWFGRGGGLAEVEVYRGDQKLELGVGAAASGCLDGRFAPQTVSDGITTSKEEGTGYWLLPDESPGWIEVTLGK